MTIYPGIITSETSKDRVQVSPSRAVNRLAAARHRRPSRTVTAAVGALGAAVLLGACGSTATSTSAASAPGQTTKSTASTASVPKNPLIGFLVPDTTVSRYTHWDIPNFKHSMAKIWPGSRVVAESSGGSSSKQLSEAQAMLTEGAKALVLIPDSATASATIVNDAHRSGVPVVEFSRLTKGAPVAALVGVNPYTVGVDIGKWMISHTKKGDTIAIINGSPTASFAHLEHDGFMSILKPAFKAGTRKEAGDIWTPGWDPSKAEAEMAGILTKTHDHVQGVVSPNDGEAFGIMAALSAAHMPPVPITGIDGGASGVNAILKGKLGMTVWRNDKTEQHDDALAVYDLLHHKALPKSVFSKTKFNGVAHVPWATFPAHVITKKNVQLELAAGAVTRREVCKGVASGVGPC